MIEEIIADLHRTREAEEKSAKWLYAKLQEEMDGNEFRAAMRTCGELHNALVQWSRAQNLIETHEGA